MTFLEIIEKEILSASKPLTIKEALNLVEQDGTLSQISKIGKDSSEHHQFTTTQKY